MTADDASVAMMDADTTNGASSVSTLEYAQSYHHSVDELKAMLERIHNSSPATASSYDVWSVLMSLKLLNARAASALEAQRSSLIATDRLTLDCSNIELSSWQYEREYILQQIQAQQEYTPESLEKIRPLIECDAGSADDENARDRRVAALKAELEARDALLALYKELQSTAARLESELDSRVNELATFQSRLQQLATQTLLLASDDVLSARDRLSMPLPRAELAVLPAPLYTLYHACVAHHRVFDEDLKLTINTSTSLSIIIAADAGVSAKLTIDYNSQWSDVSIVSAVIADSIILGDQVFQLCFSSLPLLSYLYPQDRGHSLPSEQHLSSLSASVAASESTADTRTPGVLSYYWLQRICGLHMPHRDQNTERAFADVSLSDAIHRVRQRINARANLVRSIQSAQLQIEAVDAVQLQLSFLRHFERPNDRRVLSARVTIHADYPLRAPALQLRVGSADESQPAHVAAAVAKIEAVANTLEATDVYATLAAQLSLTEREWRGFAL